MLRGKVLITGGAGYLGRAILKRAIQEGWDCHFTVFSTDSMKHHLVKTLFPKVHSVIGDIRDANTLYNAMTGKDVVIHAAAVKHIPDSEWNSIDTYEINVDGSMNVARIAAALNISDVLAISTDKACHAANAYGASKYLMEKIWQEFSRVSPFTNFHLVRYGNVLESTGSVIEVWKQALADGRKPKITSPEMTRFWLSPKTAVTYVLQALEQESGNIFIPAMPSLSIGDLFSYTLGEGVDYDVIPLRPGEKNHETLLTEEEGYYVDVDLDSHYVLRPTTTERNQFGHPAYSSDKALRLTKEQLTQLLNDN